MLEIHRPSKVTVLIVTVFVFALFLAGCTELLDLIAGEPYVEEGRIGGRVRAMHGRGEQARNQDYWITLTILVDSDRMVALDAFKRDGWLHLRNVSMGLSSPAMTNIDGKMERLLRMDAYFVRMLQHLSRRRRTNGSVGLPSRRQTIAPRSIRCLMSSAKRASENSVRKQAVKAMALQGGRVSQPRSQTL